MSDTSDSSSEREPDATSGAPDGLDREERDEAFLTQASNLVKTLKQGVVVTGERVHETIEDAVRRGRMTRKDAHELAAAIVSASRRQTDELRHELELLLERGKARKGRGDEGESSSVASAVAAKGGTAPAAGAGKARPAAAAPKAGTAKPRSAAAKAKAVGGSSATKAKAGTAKAKAGPAKKATATARKAAAKPEAGTAKAKSATAGEAKPAAGKPKPKAAAAAPFAGYDELTATEVGKRLAGLSAAELRAVRAYEEKHAGRKTVLAAVDRRLAA